MRRTRNVGATVGCSREYFRMICRAHTCRGDSRFTEIKQVVALTKPLKEIHVAGWAPEEEWEGVLAQEVLQIEMLKCDDVEV